MSEPDPVTSELAPPMNFQDTATYISDRVTELLIQFGYPNIPMVLIAWENDAAPHNEVALISNVDPESLKNMLRSAIAHTDLPSEFIDGKGHRQ